MASIQGKNLQVEDRNIFVVLPWPLILKATYPGYMGSSLFHATVSTEMAPLRSVLWRAERAQQA